ncbi:MAG: SDR family oxidoreductase [Chitinophagales bacterium]|nr:SDR family oxidoreductase [Hyphomicrobiales bacterium]
MRRLEGKIALITGAGNGLGLAMARLFATEGAFVYVTDMDGGAASAGVAAINEGGAQASGHRLDVTDVAEIGAVFAAVNATHGKLDILVNNAGNLLRADFRHTDDAMWESVLNPHLWGAIRVTRAALPLLQASGNAAIVNLSSIMAEQHARQLSAYSTAKAAVAGLSRSLAVELAPYGIRVNYMCPGFIPTAMTGRYTENPLMAKALLAQMPLRRFGKPEEVAKVALFLASDDSAYTTGEGIMVDGGMSLNLA